MTDLHQLENLKRDQHLDPRERWQWIRQAIAWADAQAPVSRNTPQRCLEEQARKRARG